MEILTGVNKMKRLVAITGEIGSGKSTVAGFFKKLNYTEYMFAQPLKEIAVILGFEKKDVFGTQADKLAINEFWGISGREFMQKFGTEVCRDYLPKILPSKLQQTIWIALFEKFYLQAKTSVVVSDLRFPDELLAIKKHQGIIIKVIRPTSIFGNSQHKSEHNEIPADIIIENSGTVDDLWAKFRPLLVLKILYQLKLYLKLISEIYFSFFHVFRSKFPDIISVSFPKRRIFLFGIPNFVNINRINPVIWLGKIINPSD